MSPPYACYITILLLYSAQVSQDFRGFGFPNGEFIMSPYPVQSFETF